MVRSSAVLRTHHLELMSKQREVRKCVVRSK